MFCTINVYNKWKIEETAVVHCNIVFLLQTLINTIEKLTVFFSKVHYIKKHFKKKEKKEKVILFWDNNKS